MALIKFRKAKLDDKNLIRLDRVNQIIEMYREMGYTLTLRQLYYRLVTENVIANSTKEYARLIHLLTEGRMGGLVDWDGIEDRVRVPRSNYTVLDPDDAIEDAERTYILDRQVGQKNHIELWVEKDAISNILSVKSRYYGINLMVNRGFSSTTAMHDASVRMSRAIEEGRKPYILYLGDHDPSGLCMALTDIPDRLNKEFGVEVDVKHIGITSDQIKKYNPPTNPAKVTDSRAKWYIKNWGTNSWEVDALEPKVLHELIDKEVMELMDMNIFKVILEQEKTDKEELLKLPHQRDELIDIHKTLSGHSDGESSTECINTLIEDSSKLSDIRSKLSSFNNTPMEITNNKDKNHVKEVKAYNVLLEKSRAELIAKLMDSEV